tara:strand:+ start:196 stop:414 length:219 start_codon:yes stop_codon:yes gene_type:complete
MCFQILLAQHGVIKFLSLLGCTPKNPHHYLQKTYIKSIVASGSCLNKKESIKFVLPVFIGTAWSEKNFFSHF